MSFKIIFLFTVETMKICKCKWGSGKKLVS